jgi:hypothetical protein
MCPEKWGRTRGPELLQGFVVTILSAVPRYSILTISVPSIPTAALADFVLEIHGV